MNTAHRLFLLCLAAILLASLGTAQSVDSSSSSAIVPRLVNFTGQATEGSRTVISGMVGATFAIYSQESGGSPLWLETQNIQADTKGNYTVQLGAASAEGLPLDLFTSGEARWLGVRINGGEEQPRVLLLSVPYALKAADAQTLGGLPASAFMLAAPGNNSPSLNSAAAAAATVAPPTGAAVTGTGTVGYVPLWDTTSDIVSSVLFQTGSGATAKIGINTLTPASTLDVKGGATVRGTLSLPATGTATATAGKSSQPLTLAASAFNSTSSTALNQVFQWQAEPAGNDTTTPSGTLNLLFGEGATKPSETGLHIASNGRITFATGQTFPGTGDGTITGVTTASGSGLTGGGTSGTLNLSLTNACATNQILQWNGSAWACASVGNGTITSVTAGTDLTGGGNSGPITLNLDTTKVPLLAAANTFTGNQTVNGNVSATGIVSGTSFEIGSSLFGFGSVSKGNAFLGFGGNTTTTGSYNTASGVLALGSNTTGFENTANGYAALQLNTAAGGNTATGYAALYSNSGSFNTANGVQALYSNTTGYQNTATGVATLYSNTTGFYNTANGLDALRSNTSGSNNTGIGYGALTSNTAGSYNTAVGASALQNNNNTSGPNDAFGYQSLYSTNSGYWNAAFGYQALYSNTTGIGNAAFGYGALYTSTTANYGSAFGWGALHNSVGNNDAFGYAALYLNTTGIDNGAFGKFALDHNTTGDANVGFGGETLYNNTTGGYNTAIGAGAGSTADYTDGTGSNNTFLGSGSGMSTGSVTNATAIGACATVSASNAMVLGTAFSSCNGGYVTHVGIDVGNPSNILTLMQGGGHAIADGWDTYSSRRWKTNIHPLVNALRKVEQLRGVSYDLKDSGKHEIGVIAEEVGAVVPELVSYEANGKDARSVDYARLTALLIEATKQQQRELQRLRSELRETRQSLQKIKAQMSSTQPALAAEKALWAPTPQTMKQGQEARAKAAHEVATTAKP